MTTHCVLHPAIETRPGMRSFCGPTAIASLTGLSIPEVEQAVLQFRKALPKARKVRTKDCAVRGMYESELPIVLAMLGYHARPVDLSRHHSRTLWLFAMGQGATDAPLLVCVTGHAVALHGRHVVDTAHRTPTHISLARRIQAKRVRAAWQVTRKP